MAERIHLGNIKGPQGPSGADGVVEGINPNLISFSQADWIEKETYSNTNGSVADSESRTRLINKIPINKGEEYTLSDYSVYASAIRRIRLFIFDGDNFVRTTFIDRGSTRTFTADGNQVGVVLEPIENFSIQKRHLEHHNYTMMFKLEQGSEPTEMFKAIHENKRKIDNLSSNVLMVARATRTLTAGTQTPLLYYGVQQTNLVNPDNNEEILLSEGLWFFDWFYTMRNYSEGDTIEIRVLINGEVIMRTKGKDVATHNISTKITANHGDKLSITAVVPSGSSYEFDTGSTLNNRLTLYKSGGLLNV